MANILWTQVLGAMHLARIRVGIRQAAPGIPALFDVEPERVVRDVRRQRAGDRRRARLSASCRRQALTGKSKSPTLRST